PDSKRAWTASPEPDRAGAVVMIGNVALLLRRGPRGKKRGEPGCRAVHARRFPAAPHALPLVGRVRSGRARPLRQPARYQRLPGSAFAGFFPPTSACCCRRLEIATAVPLRDGEEIATDEVALPARCGTFCGNITANVPAPR